MSLPADGICWLMVAWWTPSPRGAPSPCGCGRRRQQRKWPGGSSREETSGSCIALWNTSSLGGSGEEGQSPEWQLEAVAMVGRWSAAAMILFEMRTGVGLGFRSRGGLGA